MLADKLAGQHSSLEITSGHRIKHLNIHLCIYKGKKIAQKDDKSRDFLSLKVGVR